MAFGAGLDVPLAAVELGRALDGTRTAALLPRRPLPIPSDGIIRTAVAIGPGTNVILTSGIDLALRVIERYLGRDAAARTAEYMEYRRASPTVS